ncbi:MAG: Bcr/CflA family multidrug efflux MFS transporter [Pseudonocardiaceae bacterium]|nr:Bcr/CflA family multidrug efflux MFS transporter [Pseudonocardiaceae bacterium]
MVGAPAPTRPALPRLRLILVLGSVTALGPLSVDLYLPAFPAIAAEFDASQSAVQLTLTGCLVGLAFGQLVAGPLSDRVGRRRPLLAGALGYALASVLCAVAPSVELLLGLRFVQGLAGAATMVVARAVVRDLATGAAASRLFSVLMLVTGLAPVLAPAIGGQLLTLTDWRGLFVALAVFGSLLLATVAVALPETLPPQLRNGSGVRMVLGTYRSLLADRVFLGYALGGGLAFAGMFAYISGSPFVFQGVYELTPQLYGVLFGLNAIGLVTATQINGLIVGRVAPRRLLLTGVIGSSTGGVLLLAAALARPASVVWLVLPLFLVVSFIGFVMPNSTALALADHPRAAGTASALLGAFQFVIGAVTGPLVGLAGSASAVPMALIILLATGSATTVLLTLTRPRECLRAS